MLWIRSVLIVDAEGNVITQHLSWGERERERQRERDRGRETDRQAERERDKQTEWQRQTEKQGQRHTEFSSVQDGIYALEKARMRSTTSLRSFPTSPLKRFRCSSDWRWPSLVLSRKIVSRFLFPRLSPPGDRCCDVLGFVPADSVSSSSERETGWLNDWIT